MDQRQYDYLFESGLPAGYNPQVPLDRSPGRPCFHLARRGAAKTLCDSPRSDYLLVPSDTLDRGYLCRRCESLS
ncbi:MAG TPA: hypothetical protein VHZ02_10020 [Acidimicrobiales bacterium]|nr:hypothetical protein [Acidimicrobiales bacterium]